ncbi:MAG: 50S ribosomal protein L29 [Wenzhouxiangellaceae bacterium]
MKAEQLRGKAVAELKQELEELLKEQFNLRMQKGARQLGKPHELRRVRRDIARVRTVLNEKFGGEAS